MMEQRQNFPASSIDRSSATRAGKARICIISAMHPSLNPRVVKEADALAEAGYSVSLIAPRYSKWADQADHGLGDRGWRRLRSPEFGPSAPLRARVVELLRRLSSSAALRLGIHRDWVLHGALHPAAPGLIRAACSTQADLFIGHYPAGLLAAALAAEEQDANFAFDAEDFHLGDLPDLPENAVHREIIRKIESRHLPHAEYVSAAAPLIAEAYSETYGITRPQVVLNVFPIAQGMKEPSETGRQRSLYWFSQTIGPNRGLECALEALALSRTRPKFVLRGDPAKGYAAWLRGRAKELGVNELIELLPAETPDKMVHLAAEHSVGFVGETGHSENRRIMLTNKQFVYMLAGLPTILSDIPSHRAFASEAKGAVFLYDTENPSSLAKTIDELFSDDAHRSASARAAWLLGRERYNWEVERTKLCALVKGVLKA
jgi:glycosyltransferase involved in cell wall biosynthesis